MAALIKPVRLYKHTNGIWRAAYERDGRLYYFSLRTRDEKTAQRKWIRYIELVERYNNRPD
jgi:hypothetical protein